MPEKILIVDDEANITSSFASLLGDEGYKTKSAASVEEALRLSANTDFGLVLLDLNMPRQSGLEFLKEHPSTSRPEVLVISGQSEITVALEAIKLGALDYLEKPVSPERLLASVRTALMVAAANSHRRLMVDELDNRTSMIGTSAPMRALQNEIERIAPTDSQVLITGANGTGKELVATRLHLISQRRERPFIRVNCPGIPETLFESELFGHRKGAFTGAVKDFPGKFMQAHTGTIFLDEIGDLPLPCQAKLLRVLESGEVETLGATETRQTDVRVICATNRDLGSLIAAGEFREDLFYRISVLNIVVPPLDKRRDDIPALVGNFLRRFDPKGHTRLAPETMAYLCARDYPGNVRQLKNIIERLTILHSEKTVTVADLDPSVKPDSSSEHDSPSTLSQRLQEFERGLIEQTLEQCHGNISEAARQLGTDRANLSRKDLQFRLGE